MAYSKELLEHYENPKNVGDLDKNDKGVGTGLVVDVELQANAGNEDYEYYDPPDGNTTINIVASGTGYQVGDELLIVGTSLGGASPANDMVLVIDSIGPPFDVTIGKATTNLRSLTAQSIKQ